MLGATVVSVANSGEGIDRSLIPKVERGLCKRVGETAGASRVGVPEPRCCVDKGARMVWCFEHSHTLSIPSRYVPHSNGVTILNSSMLHA